ncbi:unnamed protein product [Didymodactylos carnosus]|uniref:Uncharacterized protein n=1 Tax=Didymodactylos carnosus TaxID=1234261 RepID=A0A815T5F8_9BILA|nr:unnamed protein product [Didymodactylos carnosus]CAF4362683.1 unnamed protein product [Didymodactylos carnosus]
MSSQYLRSSTSSNIDNDDSTDNDGQIARTLHESYLLASNNGQKEIIRDIPKQQSASLQKKVNISLNDFRKVLNNIVTSSVERGPLSNELCSEMTVTKMASSEVHVQMNDDAEVALIEQILEIAKWEQMNNGKGVSSDQLLQTAHDKISVALTPETNILSKISTVITTIFQRYKNFQIQNKDLIDKTSQFTKRIGPVLLTLTVRGRRGTPSVLGQNPLVLLSGMVLCLMRRELTLEDGQEILQSIGNMWSGSAVWYEFFESLLYLLLAATMPWLGQQAMQRFMKKIECYTTTTQDAIVNK